MYSLNAIRTYDPSIRASEDHALDRAATVIGNAENCIIKSYFAYASIGNKLKVLNYFNSFKRQSMKTKI
jgi:hypothetical protein